jgi:hypothetical protein
MALISVTPPPGVITNGTDYANKGRWVDSNLIRFADGILQPIGGWDLLKSTALTGAPIGMYAYNDNSGNAVLAVGTREKVYVYYSYTLTWYDITPSGFVTPASTDPLGFGAFTYGSEDYGDARSESGLSFGGPSYSFDNWGQNLVFCCDSDGKIYEWDPSSPSTIAAAISNAPTGCNAILVSNERHLVAIGSGDDPRKIQWSDREDNTSWTATSVNSAGDLQIPTGGHALSAVKYKNDIIIFTDTGLARMYFVASPLTYGIADAGTNCKVVSPRAVVAVGEFIAWLGEKSIFVYDGTVKEMKCAVNDFIFDNIHAQYRKATCGGSCSAFNEIWWFFPSGESQTPNKYIIWNYIDKTFAVGTLSRGAYIDEGVFQFPIAADNDGFVYYHESGNLFNSKGLGSSKPTATSGPIEISRGNNMMHATQVIPDSEASTLPGVTLSFSGRFTPLGAETDFGSATFEADGFSDIRFTTKQMQMTVTGDVDQKWSLGNVRLDVTQGGSRR